MVKVKRYKPVISPNAKPFRAVRRLHLNPTYTPVKIGPRMSCILLAAYSATTAMSGIMLGACLRLAGL